MNVAQGHAAGFPQWRRFVLYGAVLVTAGFSYSFSDAPACRCILFSKAEATAAIETIKASPGCNEILKPPPAVEIGPLTQEEDCYMQSKAFTFNGGFALKQTQELGNCLYSAVLRGTDIKREFTTMHLRRLIVVMVSQYPTFFLHYLKRPIGLKYGMDRLSKKQIERGRKKGTVSQKDIEDSKLPCPFSLAFYMQHVLTNGTWGDDMVLQLISCLWQISITILKTNGLGEIRIRHNMRISKVDLVVVHAGGDHYLGCGM